MTKHRARAPAFRGVEKMAGAVADDGDKPTDAGLQVGTAVQRSGHICQRTKGKNGQRSSRQSRLQGGNAGGW